MLVGTPAGIFHNVCELISSIFAFPPPEIHEMVLLRVILNFLSTFAGRCQMMAVDSRLYQK